MTFNPFNLAGKVALVTGGNGGIGFGLAEGVAKAGGDVVIWGTRELKNREAADRLRQYGGKVSAQVVDVSDEQAVIDGMQAALQAHGRLDAVFANAGIGGGAEFVKLPTETFRRVLAVNLEGAFWTLREAAKHMVSRAQAGDAGGALVAVSSLATHNGSPANQAYAASKGALNAMIKGCAIEFARYGVRSNVILPGWIETDMTAPIREAGKFAERVTARIPAHRWGRPEDFNAIAIYLTSEASAYHNGDAITIDGGWALS